MQFGEGSVSGHRFSFSDAAKAILLNGFSCCGLAAETDVDFAAVTARLEAAPFQSKIKTRVFRSL